MYKINLENKKNKSKIEKSNLDWLWLTIIFMFSLNLFGKEQYFLVGILFIGILVLNYKESKFKITIDLLLILLFSISYFIIYSIYRQANTNSMLLFLIGPGACYIIGYFIVKADYKFIIKTHLVIALGLFLHGFLNMINYFQIYGFNSVDINSRTVPDIWTGINLASTLQGTYFTVVSSLVFYGFILLKKQNQKIIAIIVILAAIFSVISSFILGNRTLFFILVISFIISFLVYSYLFRNNNKEFFKLVFITFLILGTLYLIYICNIFGLKEFVLNSEWYLRSRTLSIADDSRILFYKMALSQMFDFPFGGYRMTFTYAHNLWLDVLNATGLIPFFILIIYTFKSLKNLFNILINKLISTDFKIFVICIYLGYFLTFMVEPILEGVPYMFLLFILFNGMMRKYIDICKFNYVSKE